MQKLTVRLGSDLAFPPTQKVSHRLLSPYTHTLSPSPPSPLPPRFTVLKWSANIFYVPHKYKMQQHKVGPQSILHKYTPTEATRPRASLLLSQCERNDPTNNLAVRPCDPSLSLEHRSQFRLRNEPTH